MSKFAILMLVLAVVSGIIGFSGIGGGIGNGLGKAMAGVFLILFFIDHLFAHQK